uniref:Receptor transporter protein 4 n=2 Tax=Pipistrellus kuhlii TaxID=59472 RepID=A0A7J8AAW7_PIPKU|nr:receptor transporter protein 4 [Pipistrellus kuhlii]
MNSRPNEIIILEVGAWEQTFQELMQEVNPWHRWTLKFDETLQLGCVAQGGKQYQQTAFGRFRCSSCRRIWGSAKVQVLCHMYLKPRESQGHVFMRLFAQRCKKCSGTQFEKPEFSTESAMRILNNLVYRIQERCYGNGIMKFSEIPVIPELPLDGSHDMANCEACNLGFCGLSSQNYMTQPSNSSFSYMEIGSFDDIFSQTQAMNQSGTQGVYRSQTQAMNQSGTQGVCRRQDSYLPRGYAPDSFSRSSTKMPSNDSLGLTNLFRWGCDRIADLWNFVASKFF